MKSDPVADTGTRIHRGTGWIFLLIFTLLAVVSIAGGYLSYKNYKHNYRIVAEQQLLAIADLKASELTQWREDRESDAAIFFKNPSFTALVRRCFEQPENADVRRQIMDWLGKYPQLEDYDQVRLLDDQAVTRLSFPDNLSPASPPTVRAAFEALRTGEITIQDFYLNEWNRRVYLSVQIPILDESDTNRPLGVLVLRIDPEKYLYPFIQKWPVPSETAETLLVRREGGDVVFVNQLRFNTNPVLSVRAPLTNTNLPAVQAALKREGIFEGRDYRGRRVMSALRIIPDSPWFMVARRDVAEVFSPVRERFWQTVGMILTLLLGSGSAVGLVWRQQRVRFYKEKAGLTEALRVSNRDLEQFAYIASHDLQEPLRMVANYMQLLERRYKDKLDQDARDFIGFAVDGAMRMQKLIDSMLEYSRVQTSKKPFEPVNLNPVLQRVLRDLEGRILETGARVTMDPLPYVHGDAIQLGLVFQNLISNALKFRGAAPPEIHVASKKFTDHWEITVRDNGIGIDPQYQERIFKIFQRLHSRAEYPGTGIGLAICRRIIERHGGETGVKSEIEKGSTFWFTLPKKGEQ